MNNNEQHIEPLSPQEAEEDWKIIISRIAVHEAKKRKRKINRYLSGIAAIFMLLIGTVLIYRMYVLPDMYYAQDHNMDIILKDSSHITLYKGSKLTVDKSFPSDTRVVFLEGDAVFNVTKSKINPFIVHAGSYQAKVLGTIFKVIQNGSSFKVDLYEGKVQVSRVAKPKESFIINPRETFSNMGSNQVAMVVPTMRNGPEKKVTTTLSFTDFSLADALNIVEKTYGIKIKFPEERAASKISLLSQDASADEIMQRISVQLNLNIKKINANTFELED